MREETAPDDLSRSDEPKRLLSRHCDASPSSEGLNPADLAPDRIDLAVLMRRF